MREEVAALKLSVKVIENTAFVCSDCGYIPAQVRCDFLSELLQSYELFVQKGEQYRAVSGTDLLEWSERKASSSRMKQMAKAYEPYAGLLPQEEFCLCAQLPDTVLLSEQGKPASRAFAHVYLSPEGRFDAIRIDCKRMEPSFLRCISAAAAHSAALLPSAKQRSRGKRNYHLAAVSSIAFFIAAVVLAVVALAVPGWVERAYGLLIIAAGLFAMSVVCFVLFAVLWYKVRKAERIS